MAPERHKTTRELLHAWSGYLLIGVVIPLAAGYFFGPEGCVGSLFVFFLIWILTGRSSNQWQHLCPNWLDRKVSKVLFGVAVITILGSAVFAGAWEYGKYSLQKMPPPAGPGPIDPRTQQALEALREYSNRRAVLDSRPEVGVFLGPNVINAATDTDTRIGGAIILIWNAGDSILRHSIVLLNMPPIESVKCCPYASAKDRSRLKIVAGSRKGSRFIYIQADELLPTEHHDVWVKFQRKQEIFSAERWKETFGYPSNTTVSLAPFMGPVVGLKH